jgi:hypothetical protein
MGRRIAYLGERRPKHRATPRQPAEYQAATNSRRGYHGSSYHLDATETIAMRADLLHSGIAPLMRTGVPVAGAPWPEPADA